MGNPVLWTTRLYADTHMVSGHHWRHQPTGVTVPPCECCSRILDGRTPGTVRYVWYTHEGRYKNYLCDSCTSHWITNALDDDGLMPAGVELVDLTE